MYVTRLVNQEHASKNFGHIVLLEKSIAKALTPTWATTSTLLSTALVGADRKGARNMRAHHSLHIKVVIIIPSILV